MNLETVSYSGPAWLGCEDGAGGGFATGIDELDELIGGWPQGGICEILTPVNRAVGLSLVMPALARLSQDRRWLAWIAPPYMLHAPALSGAGIDLSRVLLVHPRATQDALWAVEQAMRSGTCGAVLAWMETADMVVLRRLQLAAEAGNCWGVLFRPTSAARQPAPSTVLRLLVEPVTDGVRVQVLKRTRGVSGAARGFVLPRGDMLRTL